MPRRRTDAGFRRTYPSAVAMLPKMLEQDRTQAGWSVGRAAWELGVSIREYRELEAGARSPTLETWDHFCNPYAVRLVSET